MRMLAIAVCLALGAPGTFARADEIRVMTSGAFTAAYLELAGEFQRREGHRLITEATSMGTGETSIDARLAHGEAIDVVIVAADSLADFIDRGLVTKGSRVDLARSSIGMAVRKGAPKPDISSLDAFRRTLLAATSIAYSASVSGTYLTTELFQRLGVADQVLPKSRRVVGERVGAVIARGEAEIGFQQVSEILHVPGITFVGAIPAELQPGHTFAGAVAKGAKETEGAQALLKFLSSPGAAAAITKAGLAPAGGR